MYLTNLSWVKYTYLWIDNKDHFTNRDSSVLLLRYFSNFLNVVKRISDVETKSIDNSIRTWSIFVYIIGSHYFIASIAVTDRFFRFNNDEYK